MCRVKDGHPSHADAQLTPRRSIFDVEVATTRPDVRVLVYNGDVDPGINSFVSQACGPCRLLLMSSSPRPARCTRLACPASSPRLAWFVSSLASRPPRRSASRVAAPARRRSRTREPTAARRENEEGEQTNERRRHLLFFRPPLSRRTGPSRSGSTRLSRGGRGRSTRVSVWRATSRATRATSTSSPCAARATWCRRRVVDHRGGDSPCPGRITPPHAPTRPSAAFRAACDESFPRVVVPSRW